MSRKRKKHEEEENSERWLVSYADFITLLFALFTAMYAISTVDAQKMGTLVTSMRASFDSAIFNQGSRTLSLMEGEGGANASSEVIHNLTSENGNNSHDMVVKRQGNTITSASAGKRLLDGQAGLGRYKRSMDALLGPEIMKEMVRIKLEPRGMVISLGERGIFDSGSAEILPQGITLLDTIATSLVSLENHIRIEGHTDNVPIKNERFPSNWELSTARATAVISRLVSIYGAHPGLISAAGYAEHRPTAPNDTVEGRARNRRVDIVILNPTAGQVEPR
ncbi:MAG TPA: flagellar motor protein MotB [Acidobacteriota bacterium]|nr:flagellar motor protein MotB [Acidobacteriota bacterium]